MSSFTKTPPKNATKFQFDVDFGDDENEEMHDAELHAHEHEQHVAPTYSDEQMNAAREEAFRSGFEQGAAEARQGIESNLSALVSVVSTGLDKLMASEASRLQQMNEVALRTTIATLKKMWPSIARQQGLQAIEETIRQSLEYNQDEQRIVIRVHDTMLDPLIQRLPQIQEQKAFPGKIIVLADQAIGEGDCKVEWADGGLERLSRHLSAQIDRALDNALASLPHNSQKADTERTSS